MNVTITRDQLATIDRPMIKICDIDPVEEHRVQIYAAEIKQRFNNKYTLHVLNEGGRCEVYLAFFFHDLYTGHGLLGMEMAPDSLREIQEIERSVQVMFDG